MRRRLGASAPGGPGGPGGLGAGGPGQSPPSSIQAPSSHTPPFYQPKQAPMLRLTAMLALPAPPLSLLPPPSSLLLPPAKPYARPYARYKFDDSGLCWRSRPLPPPSSVFPSTTQNKPPMRGPMRALCAPPMRGTRSSKEIDRGPCFETTTKRGTLCAALCAPYARPLCAGHVHQRK